MSLYHTDRAAWWAEQVNAQWASGLSITAFCESIGVSTASFYQWRRRHRKLPAESAFLPVNVTASASEDQIVIELANANRVLLPARIDRELLAAAIVAAGQPHDNP